MPCPRAVSTATVAVLLLLLSLPSGGAGEPPAARPAATPPYDLGPWSIGDTWSYRVQIRAEDSTLGLTTNANFLLDHTVAGVEAVTVLGRTYSAYNSTVSGRMTANGMISTASYTVSTNNVTGWTLTDRSNLARIAENQSFRALGTLTVIFLNYPLWMNSTTTSLHGPAQEDLDFPLELADAWSFQGLLNTTGYVEFFTTALGGNGATQPLANESLVDVRSWFNATETVSVLAGTFPDSARVHSDSEGATVDSWYHPDVRNLVKAESHTVNGPNDYLHVWTNLTGYAPASPMWPGSISLSPNRVNPGGWTTASGLANPDEDLVVVLPATGGVYPVRADSGGIWSVPVLAPTTDDATPANADAGSHGVIVEPAASPLGWNVTTLQLMLPDLYADSADFFLSDPTPEMGVPFDLNATVRVGPSVDVRSPFNVSFSVDGVEIARIAAANLTAGGSQSSGTTWSGPPGWHTATFVADPDGAIPESDEGNNTASRAFLITGTDLAPWNITVTSDVVDVYANPAASGYVSSPVQGRFGALVNVTFEAANVGTRDANASFTVAVVETAGLRGPPIGLRLLDATVPSLGTGNRTGPFSASWPVPSSPGVYHLNVTVDADAQVQEAWETNNTFIVVVNVSGPDYLIQSFAVPAKVTAGSAHALNVTVRNDGQRDGNRTVPVAAYQDASPTPFATADLPPIPVGGNATVSLLWIAPPSAANPQILFVVDPVDVLDEMLESNNERSASVGVRDPPLTAMTVTGRNVSSTVLFVTSATVYSLTATDRSGEGANAWLRIDGGPDVAFVGPFSVTAEGPYTIEYWSVDGLGGRDAVHTLAVRVDDTGPEASAGEWTASGDRTTVNLSASDGDGVGVARIEYRIGDGNWTLYEGPFEVAGVRVVTFRAVDLLDNVGAERSRSTAHSVAAPATANYKPVLAAVCAAILVALGLWRQRGKAWSLYSPGAVGLVSAFVEAGTGVLSLSVAALAIPPIGLGLALDLFVFAAGLFGVLRARAAPQVAPKADAPGEADGTADATDAGTDK